MKWVIFILMFDYQRASPLSINQRWVTWEDLGGCGGTSWNVHATFANFDDNQIFHVASVSAVMNPRMHQIKTKDGFDYAHVLPLRDQIDCSICCISNIKSYPVVAGT
jgi:hypothetical protein